MSQGAPEIEPVAQLLAAWFNMSQEMQRVIAMAAAALQENTALKAALAQRV